MRARLFLYVIIFYILSGSISCRKSNLNSLTTAPTDTPEETLPPVLSPVSFDINDAIKGYYKALPSNYATSGKSYPLLVFLHGGGGFGNGNLDLPLLLNEGIPLLLDEKLFPPEFVIKDKHFSFVHLAPQFIREPSTAEVRSFIKFATEHFRVDTSRIYLTGMSNGGKITCNVAETYPYLFAAIVAMAGVSDTTDGKNKLEGIVRSKLPVWVFHNDHDEVTSIDLPTNFITTLNNLHPDIAPRFTIFPSEGLLGHDAWTRATDPGFKEDNRNIYEWMLEYRRIKD